MSASISRTSSMNSQTGPQEPFSKLEREIIMFFNTKRPIPPAYASSLKNRLHVFIEHTGNHDARIVKLIQMLNMRGAGI